MTLIGLQENLFLFHRLLECFPHWITERDENVQHGSLLIFPEKNLPSNSFRKLF